MTTTEPDGWRDREFIDFPTAWWIAGQIEHTDPRCSYAQTNGALLCDCSALHLEWARRRGAVHDWTELDALIKRNYETGEHGGRHIAMPETLHGALRARDLPKPAPSPVWGGNLGQLTAIPIVLDNEVPHNEWRLRDNAEGHKVVLSGVTRRAQGPTDRADEPTTGAT